jgi:protein TonB
MKYERAKPNVAGLTSQLQQDEMRLILAGLWPPLKPLPVFKYGADEYRAEIHFDRTRGEWVCRKTSLPSNKVEELRGRLTEMTMALPHTQAEVFTEAVEAEPQEQELENEANRRLQAILEWRENYGNGALYSELQAYLSESQQDEIYDSIRMTLTARQLQFNPKNVEFVFDALWNARGRLATLIGMAQRNKAQLEAAVQAPRYEGMFPSESTYAKHTTVDGIKLQEGPLSIPAVSHSDAGHSVIGSAGGISTSDFPQRLEASFPSERARHFVPEPIKTSLPELSETPTEESVDGFIPTTLENFPTEPIVSVSPVAREILGAIFVLLFAVIGFTLGLTVGRGRLGRSLRDTEKAILAADATPSAPPSRPGETTSPTSTPSAADTSDIPAVNPPSPETEELRPESTSAQSLNARPADSVIRVRPTEPSSAVTSRFHIDSDLPSGANKLDDTPPSEEKSREGTRDSDPSVKVPSTDSNSSPTIESKQSAIPEAGPKRSGSTGIIARSVRPPATAEQSHSKVAGGSIPSARDLLTTKPVSAATPKSSSQTPSLKHIYPAAAVGLVRSAPKNVALQMVKPVTATAPKPSVVATKHNRPALTDDPKGAAPGNLAPREITPATGTALQPSPPSVILVTAPPKGSKSFRLTFPEKPIAASSSFAITSQLSVLVHPEAGPGVARQPTRLQAGELVSYVWLRYPKPGDRFRSAETVKVRATIGQLGQVLDIKRLSGSTSLLPAAMSAIRQWRYKPTLLNERPVQAQQDVTIEFQPPKYLSHLRRR